MRLLPNLNLNWLRTFETAARLLSFTAAAQELGLTQTAVSQHIKALEARLGQNLFVRRPRSVQLTDVGQAYLMSVRDALEGIALSTGGLFGPDPSATVTLRASMAFNIWLAPRLGAFRSLYPETGVKLITEIWADPADAQPIGAEVLLAQQPPARGRPVLLAEESIVPVCAAASPAGFLQQERIHILGYDDHWGRYLAAAGHAAGGAAAQLTVDTSVAAVEMAEAGLGCAMVIRRFAEAAIAAGRRIRIAGPPAKLGQRHYLLRGPGAAGRQPQVDRFAEWLQEQF